MHLTFYVESGPTYGQKKGDQGVPRGRSFPGVDLEQNIVCILVWSCFAGLGLQI